MGFWQKFRPCLEFSKFPNWNWDIFRKTKILKAQGQKLAPNISKSILNHFRWKSKQFRKTPYTHFCKIMLNAENFLPGSFGMMKGIGKDILSNTSTHACNSLVIAEILEGNTNDYPIHVNGWKKYTCKQFFRKTPNGRMKLIG